MRTVALAAISMAGVLSAPAAAQDREPDWIRRPSAEDLMGVWPRKALKEGLGGRVVLVCIATVQGTLRACRVESQDPPDAGFGGAALALGPQFVLKPALRGGAPVEAQVRIPINFPKPTRDLSSFIAPNSDQPNFRANRVYSRLPYREAPTVADVAAAYPAKARAAQVGGSVSLNCQIGRDGHLGSCTTIREEPMGQGFAGAARKLAPKFVVPTKDGQGQDMAGARTVVLVTFAASSLGEEGKVIGQPRWTALPRPADMAAVIPPGARAAGALQARVVIRCTVSTIGTLEGCETVSEDPTGVGYDAAALTLSKAFRMAIWTEEGLPTVGGVVRVPIRFQLNQKPAPPAP